MPKPTLSVLKSKAAPAVERSVDDYLASVKARGLSPRTVKHYDAVLHNPWLPFLAEQGVESVQAIDQRLLDRFNAKLLTEGGDRGKLSVFSVNSYVGTVALYLNWARKDGEFTSTAKPQMPKLPQRHIDVLTRKEIQSLEDVATTERDKLIVRVLADSGLRLSELLGLTRTELIEQGRDRYMKIHGKGSRDRLVPLQPGLYQRLRRYADNGRPKGAASDRIFLTAKHSRKTGNYERLVPRAVQDLMDTLAAKAEIDEKKKTNPHALRHSFATYCLQRGMSVIQLQRILGHSSLEMLNRVYSHLAPTDAAAALNVVLRSDDD